MSHTCQATGCTVAVPPRIFMCRPHWFSLPKAMRDAVSAAYVPGQEITKTPSAAYLRAARAAIEHVQKVEIDKRSREERIARARAAVAEAVAGLTGPCHGRIVCPSCGAGLGWALRADGSTVGTCHTLCCQWII